MHLRKKIDKLYGVNNNKNNSRSSNLQVDENDDVVSKKVNASGPLTATVIVTNTAVVTTTTAAVTRKTAAITTSTATSRQVDGNYGDDVSKKINKTGPTTTLTLIATAFHFA